MEFDITVRDGRVLIGEQAMELLEVAKKLDLEQKRMAIQMDAFKEALRNAMEENGVKSFENDTVKVVYKGPQTRKTVDTKKLKDEGVYDFYTKDTQVKSSVTVSFKE